jgi:hypothetical protein
MLTHAAPAPRKRAKRPCTTLKIFKIPFPPKNLDEITAARSERGITSRTRLLLISPSGCTTSPGRITPVESRFRVARARRGNRNHSLTARSHSFGQFQFQQKRLLGLRLLWHQFA